MNVIYHNAATQAEEAKLLAATETRHADAEKIAREKAEKQVEEAGYRKYHCHHFFTSGAREYQNEMKHQLHLRDYVELQKWLGII